MEKWVDLQHDPTREHYLAKADAVLAVLPSRETVAPTVHFCGRRGGKTRATIDAILSQADERGIVVEVVYPQTVAPTEEQIADAIDTEFDRYEPTFNEQGHIVTSNAARAVLALFPGESREAVEAAQRERDAPPRSGRPTVADDIREELAEVIRLQKIGPFGPNTLALLSNGKAQTHPTGAEAADIADAILASPVVARIRAEAWDEGMKLALGVVTRRPGNYETFIDLVAEANPHYLQIADGASANSHHEEKP
jgi:hypothetical protein